MLVHGTFLCQYKGMYEIISESLSVPSDEDPSLYGMIANTTLLPLFVVFTIYNSVILTMQLVSKQM